MGREGVRGRGTRRRNSVSCGAQANGGTISLGAAQAPDGRSAAGGPGAPRAPPPHAHRDSAGTSPLRLSTSVSPVVGLLARAPCPYQPTRQNRLEWTEFFCRVCGRTARRAPAWLPATLPPVMGRFTAASHPSVRASECRSARRCGRAMSRCNAGRGRFAAATGVRCPPGPVSSRPGA